MSQEYLRGDKWYDLHLPQQLLKKSQIFTSRLWLIRLEKHSQLSRIQIWSIKNIKLSKVHNIKKNDIH